MLNLLDKLLRISSVSTDIPELHMCIDMLMDMFAHIDGAIVHKIVYNEKPSLIVQNFEGRHADVVLNGHIDVVPPSQEEQFSPYEKHGKLYARGAGDMKAGIALMVELMKEICEKKLTSKKVMLMITSDEEVGGFDGVQYLVSEGWGGDVVLIPDGGATDAVVYAEKGLYSMTVEAGGKSCHSSRPRLGSNAIHNIINYFTDLRAELQETELAYYDDAHRGTTVNINMLHAGIAKNQIPDAARATIDIRFTEKYRLNQIKQKALNIMPSYQCKLLETIEGERSYTDPELPVFQAYMNTARQVIGPTLHLDRGHGASDGRFFTSQGSCVILHRPDCDSIHAIDERVDIASIEKVYTIYKKFICE